MESTKDKVESLKWAIEELQKQRDEFDGKLKIAHKREETGTLIEEVHAQKDALEKRISALQDGLKVSSDMVDTPVEDLEEEISQVDDKLEIAKERLQNLEQEQYLEELGRNLNRSHEETEFDESLPHPATERDFSGDPISNDPSFASGTAESDLSEETLENLPSTTTQTMSTPSNRIETEQKISSRLPEEASVKIKETSSNEKIVPIPVEGLEETAMNLGVDPEFLVEKGTQALLRMIARNGGQLRFPLEIDQID